MKIEIYTKKLNFFSLIDKILMVLYKFATRIVYRKTIYLPVKKKRAFGVLKSQHYNYSNHNLLEKRGVSI